MFSNWNLNSSIKVKLTPEGRKVLLQHHLKNVANLAEFGSIHLAEKLQLQKPDTPPTQPNSKEPLTYTFQGHQLLEIFGGSSSLPLDTLMGMVVEIEGVEPTKAPKGPSKHKLKSIISDLKSALSSLSFSAPETAHIHYERIQDSVTDLESLVAKE